jgi:serine/threonine protein kinase
MQNNPDGISYRELLEERNGKGFPEPKIKEILQQILKELKLLHERGIVHGNVSLETLIQNPQNQQATLINPQEVDSDKKISAANDIYDLCITAILLLTGKPPDVLQNLDGTWNWQDYCLVNDQLTTILNKALSQNPKSRYSHAEQMLQAMQSNPNMANIQQPRRPKLQTNPVYSPNNSGVERSPISTRIQTPSENSNKNALIVGSLMISGSVLFGSILLAQRFQQEMPPNSLVPEPEISLPVNNSSQNTISQDQALQVVQEWLGAKNSMFGPPYNQQLGESLTVGKALSDNIRGPSSDGEAESSLEWLKNRGKYWKYGTQKIESVKNFVSDDQNANITVSVYEQRSLYASDGSIEKNISKTNTTVYTLRRSGGRLKIADFKSL